MEDYPTHQPKSGVNCAVSWILFLILAAFVLVILEPFVDPYDKHKARNISCLSNLKEQGVAFQMYAEDYDNVLPPSRAWVDELHPYLQNERVFVCPEATHDASEAGPTVYSYACNSVVSGAKKTSVSDPAGMPLTYDSSSRLRNRTDPFTSLPNPGRHNSRNNISFVDGHVKSVDMAGIRELQEQM